MRVLSGLLAASAVVSSLYAYAQSVPALYTAAQAAQGAAVFAQSCATCHGANLEGVAGPALKGPAFRQMAQAQNLNAQSLFAVISQSMPQDNPGSLSPAQYAALTAYILQQNGYPAGAGELSKDTPNLKDLNLSQ
ncbi:MAG TPA: cytochrome c [Rhizomicrobium sp.]|nr:cytochrome c [Rhizomicrobium sp.]